MHNHRLVQTALSKSPIAILVLVIGIAPAVGDDKPAKVKLLSNRGSTRATRYSSANKIVTIGKKTHIAWLDSVSRTMIASFDRENGKWSRAVHVGDGQDNHGGPALTCDSRGYLHIVFGPHVSVPFQHYRSAKPNDATQWIPQEKFGSHPTYPSLICDARDTLHIIYRGGPKPKQPLKLIYQRKPRNGEWSKPIVLAKCPDDWRGYTHYHSSLTIDQNGSLHIAFNLYFNGRARHAGYLKSNDRGRTWRRADGKSAALPVTTASKAIFLRSKKPMKVTNVVCDRSGVAWITISRQGEYSIHRYVGGQWRMLIVNNHLSAKQRKADLYWGTAGIADDGRLFVPVVVGKGVRGGVIGDLWLLVSKDRESRFTRLRVAAPDPKQPHTGLSLERFTGHNPVATPWLLFSTGPKGPDNFGRGLYHRVHAVKTADVRVNP